MKMTNKGGSTVIIVIIVAVVAAGIIGYAFLPKPDVSGIQDQDVMETTAQLPVQEEIIETTPPRKAERTETDTKAVSPPVIAPEKLTLLTPNGGETLVRGKTYVITWANPDHIGPIDIFLVKDGQIQTDVGFAPGAETTAPTSFTWTVKSITLDLKTRETHSLPDGGDYKIRVSNQNGDVFDESDRVFSIVSE